MYDCNNNTGAVGYLVGGGRMIHNNDDVVLMMKEECGFHVLGRQKG
jgi:hypothetical protein